MSNEVPHFLTSSSILPRAAATHYNDEGIQGGPHHTILCLRQGILPAAAPKGLEIPEPYTLLACSSINRKTLRKLARLHAGSYRKKFPVSQLICAGRVRGNILHFTKSTKSKMMNSLRKGSDASSGFLSESFSSQNSNGLKTPPPHDFKTRKWKLHVLGHNIVCGKFMDISANPSAIGGYRFASAT